MSFILDTVYTYELLLLDVWYVIEMMQITFLHPDLHNRPNISAEECGTSELHILSPQSTIQSAQKLCLELKSYLQYIQKFINLRAWSGNNKG